MHKSGIRPTRRQRELLEAKRLQPESWLVRKDTTVHMEIINRVTGKAKIIVKGGQ
ncbi:hypothetical protein [Dehalobacter restrictus]|uniref:DUF6906 family protein n=1 Tax=Dehalobacter restrictus TaxID=55583 RepID=UPI00338F2D8E